MAINGQRINKRAVNSGFMLVAQYSGSVLSLTQSVELRETYDGLLLPITQSVTTLYSGSLLTLSQAVVNPAIVAPFVTRNGWYPIITIGTYRVPDDMLTGMIEVTRTESNAALMTFSIRPALGVLDITRYVGQAVKFDVIQSVSGQAKRVYTGRINLPEIDLINGRIKFNCSDNRKEQINALPSVVDSIGIYNTDISGIAADSNDELETRLTTVPYSFDFNAYGNYRVTHLLAKTTPDYTLGDSDVYRDDGRDPVINLAPRSRFTNTVNIKAQYTYQRAYRMRVAFAIQHPTLGDVCTFLRAGWSVPTKAALRSTAEGCGWPLVGSVTFEELPAGGWYACGGAGIGWNPISATGSVNVAVTRTNPAGGDPIPVKDAAGNQVYKNEPTGYIDMRQILAFGASWTGSQRFTQNITENYTITVTAPQSIADYGTVSTSETVGVQSEFDSELWDNNQIDIGYPTGGTGTYNLTYWDKDTNLSSWYTGITAMLSRAMTSITKAHRDNHVIFHRRVWPEIDLEHTVYLNCTRLQAQGKVYELQHSFNIDTGEAYTRVDLALSRSTGSSATSSLSIPTRPTYTPSLPTDFYVVNGTYTGNYSYRDATGGHRTANAENIEITTPAIPDEVRANKVLDTVTPSAYTVSVQNDLLEVTLV